jgi:cytochrome b561
VRLQQVTHYFVALIGMPLIGWGMLSAATYPVVLFGGVHLPAILPQSDSLHALLWDAHFYLAFVFFALILLHVAAALFHALIRRDGVFEALAPVSTHDGVAPVELLADLIGARTACHP